MSDEFYLNLVKRMLSFDFPGQDDLKTQIKGLAVARVTKEYEDGSGVIELSVTSGLLAVTASRQPIDVESHDEDGAMISALLFVDDGKLHLIDIYRIDGLSIKKMPKPDSFIRTFWEEIDEDTQVRKQ